MEALNEKEFLQPFLSGGQLIEKAAGRRGSVDMHIKVGPPDSCLCFIFSFICRSAALSLSLSLSFSLSMI